MSFPSYVHSGEMLKGNAEFLSMLRDLCYELGVEGYNPSTVRLVNPTRAIPSDQPLVFPDGLVLPTTLVGKLVPSEWKPLIASALIFRRMARDKRLRRSAFEIVKFYLLGLLLLPVFFVLSFLPVVLFNFPLSTGVVVGIPTYFGVVFVLNRIRSVGRWRKIRLKADQQTAALVGKEAFLQALERIDGMHLEDVERVKHRGFIEHFFYTPSIIDRMVAIGRPTPTRDEEFSRFRKQWTSSPAR
ncbi:hypothetical protein E6H19_06780 [Candidatus Bathyarchaeota archaeon]|nr:MAG: hypothetical protein E6H30_07595 [Candidatus Bathyarchaeota archaeon]TMI44803.1 MAG: hypothetical protein E6H19_06780 [Candidatus Bathyarchaeota archaeon]